MDLKHAKRVGTAAAYKGGEILRSYFGKTFEIRKKGATDLVTEADIRSEKQIIETIRNAFPDHSVLAEESGVREGTARYQWIIDPLDGTTNFSHGLSFFAVSVAFAVGGNVVVGIVFCPITGEIFTAVSGEGAELNGRTIRVSESFPLSESLLVTGFPYDLKKMHIPTLLTRFTNCLKAAQGIRRFGSAALDLCLVACGRFDGFWEQHLNPWDTAAGALIAKEAGATVTDFSNHPFTVDKKEILATNGKIHEEMLLLLEIKDRE